MNEKNILKNINQDVDKSDLKIINFLIYILVFTLGFIIGRSYGQDKQQILDYAQEVSRWYDIPTEILPALILVESSFDQSAVSYKDAHGLMQVTEPAYIDYRKCNPGITSNWISNYNVIVTDWKANIAVGAWYLVKVCYRHHPNWKRAISAYFWGAWNTNIDYNDNMYLAKAERHIIIKNRIKGNE